jgi:signal transduction histidine kinase
LGLAIARGLLDLHDGTIEVDNRERGCRFSLRLPVSARS